MKRIFVAENTMEGMFSAIYDAWKSGKDEKHVGIALKGVIEQELFCEYIQTKSNQKKACAVEKMIKKNLGEEIYKTISYALLSEDEKKADAVFGMMQEAKRMSQSRRIMEHLQNKNVTKVFELSRNVSNEAHAFIEFLRFREIQNKILAARISPKNSILTCIAGHFENRFPNENFLIYDEVHHVFLIHQSGRPYFFLTKENVNFEKMEEFTEKEEQFAYLWKLFHKSISIQERENRNLQMANFPLRYRGNVLEFDENRANYT